MKKIGLIFGICMLCILAICMKSGSEKDRMKKAEVEKKTMETESVKTDFVIQGGYQNEIVLEENKNVFQVGDTVKFSPLGPEDMYMECTVNKVLLTKDLNELGISREECMIHSSCNDYNFYGNHDQVKGYIDENGKIVSNEGYDCAFLCLDITVHNIDYDYKEYFDNLWIMSSIATKEQIMQEDGFLSDELIYFSGHPEIMGSDYLHYDLAVGDTAQFKVAFMVDRNQCDMVYYVLNYNYEKQENIRFIKIDLQEGEIS